VYVKKAIFKHGWILIYIGPNFMSVFCWIIGLLVHHITMLV